MAQSATSRRVVLSVELPYALIRRLDASAATYRCSRAREIERRLVTRPPDSTGGSRDGETIVVDRLTKLPGKYCMIGIHLEYALVRQLEESAVTNGLSLSREMERILVASVKASDADADRLTRKESGEAKVAR